VTAATTVRPNRPIEPGQSVGSHTFPLSLQRLIMCSAASLDFAPAHVADDAARQGGAPGAYADITFVFAMVEKLLVQWAGPDIRVRALGPLEIRDFVLAGADVITTGSVVEVRPAAGDGTGDPAWTEVTVSLEIRQSDGRVPVTGLARVEVPV
jgi:acyl dehydratase